MANYEELKQSVRNVITSNGNNEITGQILRQCLIAIINSFSNGYLYAGIATPTTNPGTPDQKLFYIAMVGGNYVNFGNIVLQNDELAILQYDGSWTKTYLLSYNKIGRKPITYIDAQTTNVNGYIINTNLTQSSNNPSYQYSYCDVYAGETYRISGRNTNELYPCAFLARPNGAKIVLLSNATGRSFVDAIVTIEYDGVLYVNGNVDLQAAKIEKATAFMSDADFYSFLDGLVQSVTTMQADLLTLDNTKLDRRIIYAPKTLTIVNDYYMRNDGNLSANVADGRQYTQFAVNAGEKYIVNAYGIAACNAVLLKRTNNVIVALLETGPFEDAIITVPFDGTLYINGNTQYMSISVKEESGRQTYEQFYEEFDALKSGTKIVGFQAFNYGTDGMLKIASKFQNDPAFDIVQFWKNTLQYPFDTIFSFYLVKKIANASMFPSADVGINDGTEIMAQSSDCILATRFNRNADFSGDTEYCGGNHTVSYNGQSYKTAETVDVKIYADGVKIQEGDTGIAKKIEIVVTTNVYDPFILYDSVVNNPSNPNYTVLFVETMVYRIINGGIHCIVGRSFKRAANMDTYGGFASMAGTLQYGYFPMGAPVNNAGADKFGLLNYDIGVYTGTGLCDKADYPNFNHFIRRNADSSIFESVFMTDYESGDHAEIPSDYSMYWAIYYTNWNKVYHRVTYHKNFASGDVQRLECLYNWFIPVENNTDYIVYAANDYLIIDVKGAFSGVVPVPQEFVRKQFSVVQRTNNITTMSQDINPDGVDIVATGNGSVILKIEKQ